MKTILDIFVLLLFVFMIFMFIVGFNKQQINKRKDKMKDLHIKNDRSDRNNINDKKETKDE